MYVFTEEKSLESEEEALQKLGTGNLPGKSMVITETSICTNV